jgi:predicted DNA-binding antitoxin AbrB/MazE fold protein
MPQVTEAIYRNGHLEPLSPLDLPDQERVTVIVQTHERPDVAAREAALQRLLAGIDQMNFRSTGSYPTRDELHERD